MHYFGDVILKWAFIVLLFSSNLIPLIDDSVMWEKNKSVSS